MNNQSFISDSVNYLFFSASSIELMIEIQYRRIRFSIKPQPSLLSNRPSTNSKLPHQFSCFFISTVLQTLFLGYNSFVLLLSSIATDRKHPWS
jgi:hypothetical protein